MSDKPMTNKGGRPTNAERLAKRAKAAEVLDGVDQQRMWKRFLDSSDERIAFDAWKYLNDRVYGKPPQSMRLGSDPDAAPLPSEHRIIFVQTQVPTNHE